jgi:UDP-glucose 4-epimerase
LNRDAIPIQAPTTIFLLSGADRGFALCSTFANKALLMTEKFPILVTGGAGYIGSHAVLALRDTGWPVVVIDNLVTGFRWAVPEGVGFVEADIGDAAAVSAAITAHGIGAIMHFAGSVVVPESVVDPLKYYRNNTANSRTLLESAVKGGVRHFIFSSTAATYGIAETTPVREDSPKRPINPYGMSKLMTEFMLADVAAISTWPAPTRSNARASRP